MLNVEQRFWQKIQLHQDGCWGWSGEKNSRGYARISRNGRRILAHRFSWELHYGLITPGLCVLHHCDNRSCVRPDHLFLGTFSDNNLDMWEKHRHPFRKSLKRNDPYDPRGRHCNGGQNNGQSKLIDSDVSDILRSGLSNKEIASYYGVSATTISLIRHRWTWKHIKI